MDTGLRGFSLWSAWNKGSVSLSVQPTLTLGRQARVEQVELRTTIHLPFDKLELSDLAFGLSASRLAEVAQILEVSIPHFSPTFRRKLAEQKCAASMARVH